MLPGIVDLTIENFPVLGSVGEVMAKFGDDGKTGDVVLHFSNSRLTSLSVIAPSWSMNGDAEKVVQVSIVPLARENLAVSFYYTYCTVKTAMRNCFAPNAGLDTGGERVCAVIDYFPVFPASGASVMFGTMRVADASLESGASPSSSTAVSYTHLTLPTRRIV